MTETKTLFQGYDTFCDLKDDLLQAWNRAQTIPKIVLALGEDAANDYHNQFSAVERMKVEMLLEMVNISGIEEVQKRINKSFE